LDGQRLWAVDVSLESEEAIFTDERDVLGVNSHTLNRRRFWNPPKETILDRIFQPVFQMKRVCEKADFPSTFANPSSGVRTRNGFH